MAFVPLFISNSALEYLGAAKVKINVWGWWAASFTHFPPTSTPQGKHNRKQLPDSLIGPHKYVPHNQSGQSDPALRYQQPYVLRWFGA